MGDFWSDMLQQQKNSVPAVREDESRQALEALERDYGIIMCPMEPAELERGDFQALPADSLARLSGALQQVPGLIAGQSLQNTYQNTYANAYRLLIPKGSESLSFMKNSRLAGEFGEGAIDPTLVDAGGTIRRKAGVEKIAPPDVRAQQVAYLAFSAASLVTNQYFLQRIDRKLESIQKTTENVLEFLELNKQSELQTHCKTLNKIKNNLSFILQDKGERAEERSRVKRIREEVSRDSDFYQKRVGADVSGITDKMNKKSLQDKLQNLFFNLSNCWMALFAESLATLLELILLENCPHERIEREKQELSQRFKVYEAYYRQSEEAVKRASLQPNWLAMLGGGALAAGAAIAAAPVAVCTIPFAITAGLTTGGISVFAGAVSTAESDSKIKSGLAQSMGGKKLDELIQDWNPKALTGVIESIALFDEIINTPTELAISGEKVYLKLPEHQGPSDNGPDVELRMREKG